MRLTDACSSVFLALLAQGGVGEWLGWIVLCLSAIAFLLVDIKNELRKSNDNFKLSGRNP